MKIAVLGAGAMGMLIGGMLSATNDVTLVDINEKVVEHINQNGVKVHKKDGSVKVFYPKATTNTSSMEPVELVIVFVKAMFSKSALQNNKSIIGENTYLMTLQNGSGHEDTLMEFVDEKQIIIGTTQHNSSLRDSFGEVNHGGEGCTYIGSLTNNSDIQLVADAFNSAQLEAKVDSNIKKLIWGKMFTNISASALTGVLQCPLGYISKNQHAWSMCETLIKEAVMVAAADGVIFDVEEQISAVRKVCDGAPNGYTSIYADLAAGRKTEVDTISGSVVKASEKNGVSALHHKFMVDLIHAIEEKNIM